MPRATKIVATLGPSTDDPDILRSMIEAGLDVARINFSHGDSEDQRQRCKTLRQIADSAGRNVGVIGDLQGPKIRVRRFRKKSANLKAGNSFFLDSEFPENEGNKRGVSVAYSRTCTRMSPQETRCC